MSSLPPCRTCLAGGRTSRKIVLGWTPNPSSIGPQEKAPHQSCPLKRGTPGRRIPVYSNQLRQTVLGVTLGVFLWQDDSTPQMCHPQLQKGCVQPHALSTGSLQGHPQKCLLLANEMLGALDPTLLSQSSSVSLGCFLGVGACRIVPHPHASASKSRDPSFNQTAMAVVCVWRVPRSVPSPAPLQTQPPLAPLGRGQPPGLSWSCPQAHSPTSTTGQKGVPELSPPAQGEGVPRAVHNTATTAQHRPTRRSPELSQGCPQPRSPGPEVCQA